MMMMDEEERTSPVNVSPEDTSRSRQASSKKRHRLTYTPHQLSLLEELFRNNKYPDPEAREVLSQESSLSNKRILNWFKNRRVKHRSEEGPLEAPPPSYFQNRKAAAKDVTQSPAKRQQTATSDEDSQDGFPTMAPVVHHPYPGHMVHHNFPPQAANHTYSALITATDVMSPGRQQPTTPNGTALYPPPSNEIKVPAEPASCIMTAFDDMQHYDGIVRSVLALNIPERRKDVWRPFAQDENITNPTYTML